MTCGGGEGNVNKTGREGVHYEKDRQESGGGYIVEKTIKEMGEKTVKEGFALRRSQAKKRVHCS